MIPPSMTPDEIAQAKRQDEIDHHNRMAEAYRAAERDMMPRKSNRAWRRKVAAEQRRFNKPRSIPSPPASETPDKSETETSISKSPSSTDGFLAVAS